MATVARQAAIALENIRIYEQLEIANEQLKRRADNLRVLNDVGRQLASGLEKQEKEILDLTRDGIARLQMDTRDMYIALYDPDPDRPDTAEEIYGTLRFALEFKDGEPMPAQSRLAKNGLAEVVIRTKQSFHPPDVQKAHVELGQTHNRPIPRAWLGVPMISEGQVFGVIVLRNYKFEKAFTSDDREILEILAGQVVAALHRLRLYQKEKLAQEQRTAAENMAIMGSVAAEFAHKMNNLAGTIPVRIDMAESLLDADNPKNVKIIEHLKKIRNEADNILSAAKEIRESSEPRAPEEMDVYKLIEIAIARATNTQQNVQNKVEILKKFAEDLPSIKAERNSFLDTLTSIIKNGLEAIDVQGTVTISTRRAKQAEKDFIEIEISDTGRGISPSELSKIFDLFYTTKSGKGLGFGLWRDRTFIKRLGGEIDVESEMGKGSIFTIRIPVNTNS